MTAAHLGLGSNVGDRRSNLRTALEHLREVRVVRVSSLYETEPVGPPQPKFLNAVCEVETDLSPRGLLDFVKRIEREMGRDPQGEPHGPRIIDVDILLYGEMAVDEPGLTVPHPRMHGRAFVLVPLEEIAPGVRHPLLGKTVAELAGEVTGAGVTLVAGEEWTAE